MNSDNSNRSQKAPFTVKCPQCQTQVVWSAESRFRPFCSERCKLIDLGAWADESHKIAGEPSMDEAQIDELIDRLSKQ